MDITWSSASKIWRKINCIYCDVTKTTLSECVKFDSQAFVIVLMSQRLEKTPSISEQIKLEQNNQIFLIILQSYPLRALKSTIC